MEDYLKVSKHILLSLASLALIISCTTVINTSKAEAFSLTDPLNTKSVSPSGPLAFFEELKPKEAEPKIRPERLYKVRSGDSLTSIAKHYKTSTQRLYDANPKVKDPDAIKPGQKIRIPYNDEQLKHRKFPKNTVRHRSGGGIAAMSPTSFPGNFRGFDWGWCTYYAQLSRPDKNFRGDAAAWMAFANGPVPRVGAVAVSTVGYYGHVAIVIDIGIKEHAGEIKVRHMNWRGFGVVSEDWTPLSYWSGYIY